MTATEILKAATIDGARSALLEHQTGSLKAGKKADLVVLNTSGSNFMPQNDILNHLVYCENGASIELVFVNGELVFQNGRFVRIDEDLVLEEIREILPAYLAEHAMTEMRNRVFEPYMAEIHRRATLEDIGINRYAGDGPLGAGRDRQWLG